MNDTNDGSSDRLDRRQAIRKGVVAATAAGVVWSAPKIEGLSMRPNYAAAQSGVGGGTLMVTLTFPFVDPVNGAATLPGITQSAPCPGGGNVVMNTVLNGGSAPNGVGNFASANFDYNGPGVMTVNAVNFVGPAPINLTSLNQNTNTHADAFIFAGASNAPHDTVTITATYNCT